MIQVEDYRGPPRTLKELDNKMEQAHGSLMYLLLELLGVKNEQADTAAR